MVLYRGQPSDWPLTPSLFRCSSTSPPARAADMKWRDECLKVMKGVFDAGDPFHDDSFREGLGQHYGLRTTWLDCVDHFQTACWFALHHGATFGSDLKDTDDNPMASMGFVYVLAAPLSPAPSGPTAAVEFRDLRRKPSEWLRPHVQQGFVIRERRPEANDATFRTGHVCTLIAPRTLLRLWSNYDQTPPNIMFPGIDLDRGVRHWAAARRAIVESGLSPEPPSYAAKAAETVPVEPSPPGRGRAVDS